MTHLLVTKHSGHIVNVGRQEETKISDIAKIIMDIMGVDPSKLEIQPGPKGSAKRRCPDTSLVEELTGFTSYTSLRQGLSNTIESLI